METYRMWEEVLNGAYKYKNENPQLRFGQSLMIVLNKLYPDIYNKVAGTDADPFYVDSKVKLVKDAFWDCVEGGNTI